MDEHGNIHTRLLCSKSRVAPISKRDSIKKKGSPPLTIDRLELCGAVLLATLYQTVINAVKIPIDKVTFWCDSRIVLYWINKSTPQSLKIFAANRIIDIQNKTEVKDWRYVPTYANPADLWTRGELPQKFLQNEIWKQGPMWLKQDEDTWPNFAITTPKEDAEACQTICLTISRSNDFNLLEKYSSIDKLRRIVAYCLRFKHHTTKSNLTVAELDRANQTIIKLTQVTEFAEEIPAYSTGKPLPNKSRLLNLNPFLDANGILRVGGRIQLANITYNGQHPIILPRGHHITDLIIRNEHQNNLHTGIQATLYNLRRNYWPIDGRNQVRKIIRPCVTCFRTKPTFPDYLMGNLPRVRVTAARPFLNTGVDYCDSFYIKEKKLRNRNIIKVYVAVFTCSAVKAVHLEVVSDMTTEGFLAALNRFISRRGRCNSIYSDNGSNFKGTKNELDELYTLLQTNEFDNKVNRCLADKGIEWKFIPPLSPHFGKIWESAVKSFKHHLKCVVGNELFTFEQFNAFILEIEAILNSRPLTPLSSDPNDLLVLTPAHFIIGETFTSVPERDFRTTPFDRLSAWQHLQKVKQHFWERWRKEYLNELNIRHRWAKGAHTIQRGSVVVVKDDNLPPMRWVLRRVIETYPGADGIIRTVKTKTANSAFVRNVKRLAPLPIDNEQ